MSEFKEIRELSVILGVSCPESDYEVFSKSFIKTLCRAARRLQKDRIGLHDKLKDVDVEELSLIDFLRVYESSLIMEDGRHLWDWLKYNEYIKTIEED